MSLPTPAPASRALWCALLAALLAAVLLPGCLSARGGDDDNAGGGGADVSGAVDGMAGVDAAADDAMDDDAGASDDATAMDAAADDADDKVCPPQTGQRPSRRSEHVAASDPDGDFVVLFGGSLGVPVNCSSPTPTFESETWVYDVGCDRWTLSAAQAPAGRTRANAVWVPGTGMVVFGGRSRAGTSGPYTLHNDVNAYDPVADTWQTLSPDNAAGAPAPRFNATMVYAPAIGGLLVFGGNTSTSGLNYTANNDVWLYNLSAGTWAQVSAGGPGGPKPRFFAAGAWDNTRTSMIIYAGADESLFSQTAKYMTDLWQLDLSTGGAQWKELATGSTERPDGRFWGSLSRDAANDRYVLFAGHDDGVLGNRNDLWTFDPKTDAWTAHNHGDSFNKPANGFCDFPPDFTIMDPALPERRNGGAEAPGPDGVWLHGGKTDCGVIDDLWFLSFDELAFTEVTTATVGEACIRKGGLNCTDYCF